MHHRTTSLSAPSSQNDAGEKAAFYIFYALAEWLAMVTLLVPNVRKLCGTGSWSDYRWHDMTPKQVERWHAKQEQKGTLKLSVNLGNASSGIPLQEKPSHLSMTV